MATTKSSSTSKVTLVSRLDYQVTVEYNSSVIAVPPRGRIKDLDPSKLGTLPAGVSKLTQGGSL